MMADERDFELLDDYLSHRMAEEDHAAFRQRLQADPDLQHEYALQKRLIQGIRDARAAELKSMLNKVPVPPHNPGSTLVSKVVLAAVVSLVVAAGYWYFTQDEVPPALPPVTTQEQQPPTLEKPALPETKKPEPEAKQPAVRRSTPVETDKNQTSAGTEHSKPSLAKQPDPLQGPAPQGQSNEAAADDANTVDATEEGASLAIETHQDHPDYNFHYQFTDGKLVLFGPFDNGRYQTIDLSVDGERVKFLHYNGTYYRLEATDAAIQPLKRVTDPDVLERLDESRQPQ